MTQRYAHLAPDTLQQRTELREIVDSIQYMPTMPVCHAVTDIVSIKSVDIAINVRVFNTCLFANAIPTC